MIGILAILILATYLAAAIWTTFRFRSKSARVALTCIWLAIPTGDALIGRLWLSFKCNQGAVLIIRKTVSPIETIFVRDGVYKDSPQHFGYRIVEGTPRVNIDRMDDPFSLVSRATALGEGTVQFTELTRRTAQFGLFEADIEMDAWLKQTKVTVQRLDTYEVLGSFSWYSFNGGWIERILGASPVIQCSQQGQYRELVKNLLHSTAPPL